MLNVNKIKIRPINNLVYKINNKTIHNKIEWLCAYPANIPMCVIMASRLRHWPCLQAMAEVVHHNLHLWSNTQSCTPWKSSI